MALVVVNHLTKKYKSSDRKAVDDVSFEIHPGEIFSLLGPNGAGKTTIISMLSTLLEPTAGTASVNGYNVQREPMGVRRSIGVVPQELALYAELSAEENLRFWGEMQGLGGASLQTEIAEKLELMDLTARARDRVKTFSGGMKRRLNLAVGLLGNPPLVILDEPTVAIDPQSRRYILDYIKELHAQGVSVLYTTHYMEEAQELSDRIGIIDQGKLIALGSWEELAQLVGQDETLHLKLHQVDGGQRLAEALSTLKSIHQSSAHDGEVVLNVKAAEVALPLVLAKASELGLSIRTVEIREPNLETVFLHLTGRALRD